MWLVFGKLLYDTSSSFRVLFWLVVVWLVLYVAFEIGGIWGILILLILIALPFIISSILEKRKPKEYRVLLHDGSHQTDIDFRKQPKPEYSTVLIDNSYRRKRIKVVWLNVNSLKDYYEDDYLHINFQMTENMKGLKLFINSKSDRVEAINWNKARLQKKAVIIDELEDEKPVKEEIPMNNTIVRTLRLLKGKTYTWKLLEIECLGSKVSNLVLRLPVVYKDEGEKNLKIVLSTNYCEYEE